MFEGQLKLVRTSQVSGVLQKDVRCPIEINVLKNFSLKFYKIHRKTPVLESLLLKFFLLKRDFQHWCFPVNIIKILRTSVQKNIYERLLLTCGREHQQRKSNNNFELFLSLNLMYETLFIHKIIALINEIISSFVSLCVIEPIFE